MKHLFTVFMFAVLCHWRFHKQLLRGISLKIRPSETYFLKQFLKTSFETIFKFKTISRKTIVSSSYVICASEMNFWKCRIPYLSNLYFLEIPPCTSFVFLSLTFAGFFWNILVFVCLKLSLDVLKPPIYLNLYRLNVSFFPNP